MSKWRQARVETILGFEYYRCRAERLTIATFSKLGDKAKIANYLADTVLLGRKLDLGLRPCLGSDVESVEVEPRSDGYFNLTVKIKVGQFILADFLKEHVVHGNFKSQLNGPQLIVTCVCGGILILDSRSIR